MNLTLSHISDIQNFKMRNSKGIQLSGESPDRVHVNQAGGRDRARRRFKVTL